jgi:D-alanyl-lipoteichoic acid acyltransferase DltB (MBOAT superfamily)
VDFGFYVTFFPQLVAGPIVRAASFVPQMYQPYKVFKEEIGQAWFLILNGLVKKIVIADYIALNFVDRVFDNPGMYSGFENLLAIYGYSLQIYCDFSGYTDIAIGLAMLMGFRLPLNFKSPYKAENITDFWRRWHISLSSWLKDYLYIPLGGNRKGKFRTYINLFVTMLLGGLWHGASLRFVVWGGLHGLYLAVHKAVMGKKKKRVRKNKYHVLKVIGTFHLVTLTWIAFRADSMEKVFAIFNQLFGNFHPELILQIIGAYYKVILVMVAGYVVHWVSSANKGLAKAWLILMPTWQKVLVTIIIVFFVAQFASAELQPFIYFQF